MYECVKTIMAIDSSQTLKTHAIKILGRFLEQKDANIKYVALFLLKKVIYIDMNAV